MQPAVVSLRHSVSTPPRCVAVFAGKRMGLLAAYEQAASELGEMLAHLPVEVLLEGSSGGLARNVAAPLRHAGVRVTRVGVRGELRGEDVPGCERIEVDDQLEARRLLLWRAHAVLVLPGGLDCCAAILDALCMVPPDRLRSAVGLLDTASYFLLMERLLGHCSANGFLHENWLRSLYIEARPRRLLERVFQDLNWMMAGNDLRWRPEEVRAHG